MPLASRVRSLGQLVFCQGCCCGRTDRGKPELPVGLLKAVWKQERLNRTIQLTISGCLGPCDLTNVTLAITPAGVVWLGGLAGAAVYERLIAWARACHADGRLLPLPADLEAHRFERFPAEDPKPLATVTPEPGKELP
jgi:hypothetical protein